MKPNIKKNDFVDYHSIIEGPITLNNQIVECDPYQLPSGDWVTKISGKTGVVAVEALTLATNIIE